MNNCKVAVVIVSWNGKHLLEKCLMSLRGQTFKNFRVLLLDNGSEDGTVEYVTNNFPEVVLIFLDKNYGFAVPNNIGINRALEDPDIDFIVALNNDTIADDDYLVELLRCAERHPEAGAIQPKVINSYDHNVIDSTGVLITRSLSAVNRGLKQIDNGQFELEEEIFGASASAAMYRREALEVSALVDDNDKKDYFDSDYFAYYEDVDLAMRLRLAGYACYYTPLAKVYHVHSATGRNYSPFKAFHIHRNQYFNIIKNLPGAHLYIAMLLMPRLYWSSILSIIRGKGAAAELNKSNDKYREGPVSIVMRGWFEVLCTLPKMLVKRRQVQAMRVVDDKEIARWFIAFKADFTQVTSG